MTGTGHGGKRRGAGRKRATGLIGRIRVLGEHARQKSVAAAEVSVEVRDRSIARALGPTRAEQLRDAQMDFRKRFPKGRVEKRRRWAAKHEADLELREGEWGSNEYDDEDLREVRLALGAEDGGTRREPVKAPGRLRGARLVEKTAERTKVPARQVRSLVEEWERACAWAAMTDALLSPSATLPDALRKPGAALIEVLRSRPET